jgi:hypothetical protein
MLAQAGIVAASSLSCEGMQAGGRGAARGGGSGQGDGAGAGNGCAQLASAIATMAAALRVLSIVTLIPILEQLAGRGEGLAHQQPVELGEGVASPSPSEVAAERPHPTGQLLVVVTFATGNWMLPVPPPTSTLM